MEYQRIEVTDKPLPRIDPKELAAALGAKPMTPEEVREFLGGCNMTRPNAASEKTG